MRHKSHIKVYMVEALAAVAADTSREETFSDTFIHTQLRRIFQNMKAQRNLFLDHIELIFEIDRAKENLQTYIHTCQNTIHLKTCVWTDEQIFL